MIPKVVLWGLGSFYNKFYNNIRYCESMRQFQVVAVTAKSLPVAKLLDGHYVVKPKELVGLDFQYIIILNEENYFDIANEAINEYGISKDKLISYKVFWIPNLDFKKYVCLKESNISIISNNCWGGIAYFRLGLECLSPFKNCFLLDSDYLKLIRYLPEYLASSLTFSHWENDIHSGQRYPVMVLGEDVHIHFNHVNDISEATSGWERRKNKLNCNNIFVEMYTEDSQTEEAFSKLTQYDKKICFVPWESQYHCSMKLRLYDGQKEFYQTVNRNAGVSGLEYDLVELLLYGKKILRYEEV